MSRTRTEGFPSYTQTLTKAILDEGEHWAELQCGLYSSFSSKYLPFSWTCHHLYHPFSNLDPGQMAWSPSLSIPTVAPVTSVTYRGTVCTERAHRATWLTPRRRIEAQEVLLDIGDNGKWGKRAREAPSYFSAALLWFSISRTKVLTSYLRKFMWSLEISIPFLCSSGTERTHGLSLWKWVTLSDGRVGGMKSRIKRWYLVSDLPLFWINV